jgi:predicted DNA-binding protein (MmcQ/YjbR family)
MESPNERPATVGGADTSGVEHSAPMLGARIAAVRAWIEAKPGAEGRPFAPRKNAPPLVMIYKVMGKMFAVLSVRGVEDVILKCDQELASALRARYTGIGHRSHLDPRFWISVRLDTDVPADEIRHLVALSYDLVCAGLTMKQRRDLARFVPGERIVDAD